MSSLLFYAIRDDLLHLFDSVEAKNGLSYVPYGAAPHGTPTNVFASGRSLPKLGEAAGDSSSVCDIYVVVRQPLKIVTRKIDTPDDTEFRVDQLLNPDSVVINLGGRLSPTILLQGGVSTTSTSKASKELFSLWKRTMDKQWEKHRGVFVAPRARELWVGGGRLTASAHSPREYDLS